MTTFQETIDLIMIVLNSSKESSLRNLLAGLRKCQRRMPEVYDGVIQHAEGIELSSDQWLDFFLKVPHWRLLAEKSLMDKLSPNQIEILKKAID